MDLINTMNFYNATFGASYDGGGGEAVVAVHDSAGNFSIMTHNETEDDYDYDDDDKGYIFDKFPIRAIFFTLYTIVFCFCFFGNFAVILVIGLHWRMRSITNFALANLSFANLCVGVFCILQNLSVYLINSWVFGNFFCKMYHFTNSMSHTASIMILVVLSIERYMVICHPLKCRRLLTLNRLRVIIVGVWVVSAIYCSPRLYYISTVTVPPLRDGTTEILCIPKRTLYDSHVFDVMNFLLTFLVPMAIITILYIMIAVTLWRSHSKVLSPSASVSSSISSNPNEYAVSNVNCTEIKSSKPQKSSSASAFPPSRKRKSHHTQKNTRTNGNCSFTGTRNKKKLFPWTTRGKYNKGLSKKCLGRNHHQGCGGQGSVNDTRSGASDVDVDIQVHEQNNKDEEDEIFLPECPTLSREAKKQKTDSVDMDVEDMSINNKRDGVCDKKMYCSVDMTGGEGESGTDDILADEQASPSRSRTSVQKQPQRPHEILEGKGVKKKSFLSAIKRRQKFSGAGKVASSSSSSSSAGCCNNGNGNGERNKRNGVCGGGGGSCDDGKERWRRRGNNKTVIRQTSSSSTQSTNTNWNSTTSPTTPTSTLTCTLYSVNSNPNLGNCGILRGAGDNQEKDRVGPVTTPRDLSISTVLNPNSGKPEPPPRLRRAMAVRTIRIGAHAINSRRRVVRMLIVFVLTFFIFNIPYHARKLWQIMSSSYKGGSTFSALFTPITFLLMYSNCAINPILIFTMSTNFRASFKDLLSCRIRPNQKQTPFQQSQQLQS